MRYVFLFGLSNRRPVIPTAVAIIVEDVSLPRFFASAPVFQVLFLAVEDARLTNSRFVARSRVIPTALCSPVVENPFCNLFDLGCLGLQLVE